MTGQVVRKLSGSCPDMSGDKPEADRTDNTPPLGGVRPASGDTHVTAGVDVQRRGEQVDG